VYPVSDRFLARLAESHTPLTQVQLMLTNGDVIDLPHTGGSVTVDRGQAIRRTCTITVPDPAVIPRTPADQVSEGPVTLAGKDLAVVVADDKFTARYRASGTVVTAISALIRRSLPDATITSLIEDTAIGSRWFDVEADPWAGCQEIAAAAGAEVYATADGEFAISTLPDLATTTPVWAVEAVEGGVYISGSRAMTSDGVHNAVLARGENSSDGIPPVSALVVDNDPNSPTYWSGPYGRRPYFHTSSTLLSSAACLRAAQLKLAVMKAPNASGDISSLPNPALEPGDVIRVVHEDGTRELHQVASFSVPLDLGGDFPISTISAKEDA